MCMRSLHVGVYWQGGRLLDDISSPGFHFKLPYITTTAAVQTTVQTDKVQDIPCGTKGGVVITFDRVEVVNRLSADHVHSTVKNYGIEYDRTWIYDKIHHEINQFCSSRSLQEVYIELFDTIDEALKKTLQDDCSKWVPGLEIISIRVTKPRIPEAIRRNYEAMEAEKTKLLISIEAQKVAEKEAETEKKRAVVEARKIAEVSQIRVEQLVSEKQGAARIEDIENQMFLAREKARADADAYRVQKEAEANKLRLTPEFLQWTMLSSLSNNTKIYFGDRIPSMLFDPSDLTTRLEAIRK
eukprot:tig00020904_g15234.t1